MLWHAVCIGLNVRLQPASLWLHFAAGTASIVKWFAVWFLSI